MNQWHYVKRDKYSGCSAWPLWYCGFSYGKWGLGVVREQWGWRVMCGWFHLCKHIGP